MGSVFTGLCLGTLDLCGAGEQTHGWGEVRELQGGTGRTLWHVDLRTGAILGGGGELPGRALNLGLNHFVKRFCSFLHTSLSPSWLDVFPSM